MSVCVGVYGLYLGALPGNVPHNSQIVTGYLAATDVVVLANAAELILPTLLLVCVDWAQVAVFVAGCLVNREGGGDVDGCTCGHSDVRDLCPAPPLL